ncbi:uncharacterized protein IUM83_18016 [Phytophthora cinnamomi]|uniref:uncharacterized protein n=1 Tax=Phytophthora cinnamomi TaxID=4785 RepID=UPI003559E53B|nr:hypothetical protein IUM83_18016 [Phytophthora cinnamomi]
MGSNKENAQHFTPPTSRPQLPPSSLVFPPLPPLSPSDEENSWPGKTPPLPPLEPTATCSEAPSRRFGVEITNVLSTDAGASTRDNMVIKPPSPRAAEASKRYYQQLPQHSSLKTSHIVKKGKPALTFSADRGLKTPSMKWSATVEEDMRELTQPFSVLSLKSPLAPEVKELDKDALQSGNTIWSITPVELSALEDEMIAVNAQSIERFGKLSYAEASKRNLPGLTENHGEHKKTEEGVDQPRRVFKKYYALPVFTPSGLHQYEPEAFEEKEAPPVAGFRLSSGNKDPLDGLGTGNAPTVATTYLFL